MDLGGAWWYVVALGGARRWLGPTVLFALSAHSFLMFDQPITAERTPVATPAPPEVVPMGALLNSHAGGISNSSSSGQLASAGDREMSPAAGGVSAVTFQWTSLLAQISTSQFLTEYGAVSCVAATASMIAVGTEKGYVVVFNYHQKVQWVMDLEHRGYHEITALAVLPDDTLVVAGTIDGRVLVWEIAVAGGGSDTATLPRNLVLPVSEEDRANGATGHLAVPITKIVVSPTNLVVSADACGRVFYHVLTTTFLTKTVVTLALLGTSSTASAPPPSSQIRDMAFLPQAAPLITDNLGILAVATGATVYVLSVYSLDNPHNCQVRVHYRVKARGAQWVDWFPYERGANSKLAYGGAGGITVVELDNMILQGLEAVADQITDKTIPPLTLERRAHMSALEVCEVPGNGATAGGWISGTAIWVYSGTRLAVVSYDGILLCTIADVPAELVPVTLFRLAEESSPVLTTMARVMLVRNRVFLYCPHRLVVGSAHSWNDKLAQALAVDPWLAVQRAYYFYATEDHAVVLLLGLPQYNSPRQKVVLPYLEKMLFQCSRAIEPQNYHEYFAVVCAIGAVDLVEPLYEHASNTNNEDQFFELLMPFVASGTMTEVPPSVLKRMIWFYRHQSSVMTEILCLVQMAVVDIDTTIAVCEQNDLVEGMAVVYNGIGDFSTPFWKLYGNHKSDVDHRVYEYVAYTLTGRQWPSDKELPDEAKLQMVSILFGEELAVDHRDHREKYNDSSYGLFPVLSKLIHSDSYSILKALHEFFEDSILNSDDSTGPTRQFVVDALLDVFGSQTFLKKDMAVLAVFIGRNYPKYRQFLRLSDSVLQQMLETLVGHGKASECATATDGTKEEKNGASDNQNGASVVLHDQLTRGDLELAIQSLLTEYEPVDEAELVQQLSYHQYYGVLVGIYQKQRRWSMVVLAWCAGAKARTSSDQAVRGMAVIAECLENSRGSERVAVIRTIRANFQTLIVEDLETLISIVDQYEPLLHETALEVEGPLQYQYMSRVLTGGSSTAVLPKMVVEYVRQSLELHKSVYEVVLRWQDCEEIQPELLKILQQHHDDSQSVLLNRMGRFHDSLSVLLENYHDGLYERAVETIDAGRHRGGSDFDVDSEARHWGRLVAKLVDLRQHERLYETLRRMQPSQTVAVLNEMIGGDGTTVHGVKQLMMEVEVNYRYETEVMKIVTRLVERLNHAKLAELRASAVRGLRCGSCESCATGTGDVMFKCGHSFHNKCLAGLGGNVCVLCASK